MPSVGSLGEEAQKLQEQLAAAQLRTRTTVRPRLPAAGLLSVNRSGPEADAWHHPTGGASGGEHEASRGSREAGRCARGGALESALLSSANSPGSSAVLRWAGSFLHHCHIPWISAALVSLKPCLTRLLRSSRPYRRAEPRRPSRSAMSQCWSRTPPTSRFSMAKSVARGSSGWASARKWPMPRHLKTPRARTRSGGSGTRSCSPPRRESARLPSSPCPTPGVATCLFPTSRATPTERSGTREPPSAALALFPQTVPHTL